MEHLRVGYLSALCLLGAAAVTAAQTPNRPPDAVERSGEQIFKAACVSCHGPDGKG